MNDEWSTEDQGPETKQESIEILMNGKRSEGD